MAKPTIVKVMEVEGYSIYLNTITGKFAIDGDTEPTFGLLDFAVTIAKNRAHLKRKVHKVNVRFFDSSKGRHGVLFGWKDGNKYGREIIHWDGDEKPTTEGYYNTSVLRALSIEELREYNDLVKAVHAAKAALEAFKKPRLIDLNDEAHKQIEENKKKYKEEEC